MNEIQTRNCTKEKIYCYADLKKKPAENQSCSIETENNAESGEGNLIFQSPLINSRNITMIITGLIIVVGIAVFFMCKRHKKRR